MAAYRRGDDPTFDQMIDDVLRVREALPDAHVVAHRDAKTRAVSFHLHMQQAHAIWDLLGNVEVHPMPGGTFRFHGDRKHMDRLLDALEVH